MQISHNMIESTANKQVRNLIQLIKKAKVRRETQTFVVEGIRMFREVPNEQLAQTDVSQSLLEKQAYHEALMGFLYEVMTD